MWRTWCHWPVAGHPDVGGEASDQDGLGGLAPLIAGHAVISPYLQQDKHNTGLWLVSEQSESWPVIGCWHSPWSCPCWAAPGCGGGAGSSLTDPHQFCPELCPPENVIIESKLDFRHHILIIRLGILLLDTCQPISPHQAVWEWQVVWAGLLTWQQPFLFKVHTINFSLLNCVPPPSPWFNQNNFCLLQTSSELLMNEKWK